jgi:hypothetical protein
VYTPEDYAHKAAALWQRFTPNERALVDIGIFPAEAMNEAEQDGDGSHFLAVAPMDRQRATPKGQRDATRTTCGASLAQNVPKFREAVCNTSVLTMPGLWTRRI